ncbi:MAG: thermonuclease family protein, partial [Pyrinomonadaceae bacterium]
MRYPIVFITILGCFAATGLVYSQSVSSVSSKQLAKVWEQSGKKGDKDGMIEGNAVLIFDGDTIGIVAKDGSRYTIRLRGIDAPENRQPFGLESTNQLAYMVQGMDVVVIVGERDSNNKYIGAVFMDSEDVSLAQIRKGMAWCYNTPGITMSKVQK